MWLKFCLYDEKKLLVKQKHFVVNILWNWNKFSLKFLKTTEMFGPHHEVSTWTNDFFSLCLFNNPTVICEGFKAWNFKKKKNSSNIKILDFLIYVMKLLFAIAASSDFSCKWNYAIPEIRLWSFFISIWNNKRY